jgi:hypothetical protein
LSGRCEGVNELRCDPVNSACVAANINASSALSPKPSDIVKVAERLVDGDEEMKCNDVGRDERNALKTRFTCDALTTIEDDLDVAGIASWD